MAIIHGESVKILVPEGNYKALPMECSSYKIKPAGETLSLYAICHIPFTGALQFCDKLTKLLEQVLCKVVRGQDHSILLLLGIISSRIVPALFIFRISFYASRDKQIKFFFYLFFLYSA